MGMELRAKGTRKRIGFGRLLADELFCSLLLEESSFWSRSKDWTAESYILSDGFGT
jgi:hypothetical protein